MSGPGRPTAAHVITTARPSEVIAERIRRISEDFSALADPIDRYRHIVELGEHLPRLDTADRTEENRLPGCQYALWIVCRHEPAAGTLHFLADSDARIARGLAALIVGVVDGLPPAVVAQADFAFLDTIGLRAQLSSQRAQGLAALIDEIGRRARRYVGLHSH